MQSYWIGHGEAARQISLPAADDEVVDGVLWGRADTLDTPAYWALRCAAEPNALDRFTSEDGSLIEEIGFCLLGGFGITAEVNDAAFRRLKAADVFDLHAEISEEQIRDLLLDRLYVFGRWQHYRFPNQRASRLASMRRKFRGIDLDRMPLAWIETALRGVSGIGPKTAAWIIRNHFGSDNVAILDVHVIRACSRLRLFPEKVVLPRDYDILQKKFLSFAHALEVRPAVLDAVMWSDMRTERRSLRSLAA